MSNDIIYGKTKFSIVTVCFNSEKTIERTIRSVLSQMNIGVQYIVIDGKSVDGTMEIVDKYREYISVIISERDNGIYDAMNKAIQHCRGDVVAFINSDDWYVENALENVALAFQETKADIIVGDYYSVSDQVIKKSNQGHIRIHDIKMGIMFCHQSVFCKKEIFDEIKGFDLRYKIAADYDWLLRAVNSGKRIEHIDTPVCFFSTGGASDRENLLRIHEVYEIAMKNVSIQDKELAQRIKVRREYSLKSVRMDKIITDKRWNDIADVIKVFVGGTGLYLFGLSVYADFVIEMCLAQDIEIRGIFDNKPEKWPEKYNNIKVLSPECLRNQKVKVLVISARYIPEIEGQLNRIGYEKNVDFINLLDIPDKRR